MAIDMFLDIPGVEGESADKTYSKKIDVLGFKWGMTQSGTFHQGTGGGAGKVSVHDITISKFVDKASPNLMFHCASGKHLASAKLIVRKAAGDSPLDYFVVEMTNVLVAALDTDGGNTNDRPSEAVTLNFAQVKFIYKTQMDNGSPGPDSTFGWDVQKNVKI
ncbi:MAG TPA: type VI secretion system tube protein Hcp [Chiayiivirga sp.]|nr:type VI secretion system tube protein Hcp [Chiayiivirga sp.]